MRRAIWWLWFLPSVTIVGLTVGSLAAYLVSRREQRKEIDEINRRKE